MDPLLGTLVLILLALLGARASFSTRSVPAGPRLLFRTGIHYAFVGFLLGPTGLALLDGEAVAQLYPLMAIALGWIGFLFGMQLDRSSLRQFPASFYALAFGQALLAYFLFYALARGALAGAGLRGDVLELLVLAAAATACITTPAGIAMISANFLVRGHVGQLLFFIGSLDGIVGILALQTAYAIHHPTELVAQLGPVPAAGWPALAVGLGLVLGIVFLWLNRPRPAREELVLFLLGMAALASGAALQLQLSPLFVCMVLGAVVANLAPDRQRVFQALEKWEKPIYVTLLVLAGALFQVETWWVLPLAVAYAAVRAVAKVAASAVLVPAAGLPFPAPRTLGLGLIPQGGISLAMAVSIVLTYSGLEMEGGGSAADLLFGVILLGVVASEVAGPYLTAWVLRGAGEISPSVEQALARGDQREAEHAAIRTTQPAPVPAEGPDGGRGEAAEGNAGGGGPDAAPGGEDARGGRTRGGAGDPPGV